LGGLLLNSPVIFAFWQQNGTTSLNHVSLSLPVAKTLDGVSLLGGPSISALAIFRCRVHLSVHAFQRSNFSGSEWALGLMVHYVMLTVLEALLFVGSLPQKCRLCRLILLNAWG